MRIRLTGGRLALVALAAALGCERPADQDLARDTTTAAEQADRDDMTLVRFVHAAPNAPKLDIRSGEQATFSQVAFKDVTPYREIESNRPEFRALPADQAAAEPLAEDREMVLDGKYYTVVAVPKEDGKGVELETLRDDSDPGDLTKSRLRIVHAARRAGDIDVVVGGREEPLWDDLGFGADPDYKDVMPGAATLVVRSGKTNRVLLQMAEMQLAAGESVTIVLTHPSVSSEKIEAIRISDQSRAAAPAGRADTIRLRDDTLRIR